MKLEYLVDISDGGRYKDVVTDKLVRLYDFDVYQAIAFRNILSGIIKDLKPIDLKSLNFINPINCNLTIRITDIDIGITTKDNFNLYCDLTRNSYENMIELLEPFCNKETSGYQWLYNVDCDIDFLFSPGGEW